LSTGRFIILLENQILQKNGVDFRNCAMCKSIDTKERLREATTSHRRDSALVLSHLFATIAQAKQAQSYERTAASGIATTGCKHPSTPRRCHEDNAKKIMPYVLQKNNVQKE
jgi:hypothetical protein